VHQDFSDDFEGVDLITQVVDVYTDNTQVTKSIGGYATYKALRDISNGAVCMTEISNNKVYAVMTDPSRNSLAGNAGKYLLGVALEDALATQNIKILSNGYCTIRGDFTNQVPTDPNGVTQGNLALSRETNGNSYTTDASGILFTDSGGTSNYNSNENMHVSFDAGLNNTIDLSINELYTEHGYSSLWDRLGFQVSDDGEIWENADISGLIQTKPNQLFPPWPPGGTGTASNDTVITSQIKGHGWIFPERHEESEPNSLFITRRDHSGNPTGTNQTYMSQIKKDGFGDKMKRYIRFYFRSDGSSVYSGWQILVKSSGSSQISVTKNSILYLSQSEIGGATAFTGSGIRLGYSVIDPSNNGIDYYTYARIQDTNN
jgi:hypothetical protein